MFVQSSTTCSESSRPRVLCFVLVRPRHSFLMKRFEMKISEETDETAMAIILPGRGGVHRLPTLRIYLSSIYGMGGEVGN